MSTISVKAGSNSGTLYSWSNASAAAAQAGANLALNTDGTQYGRVGQNFATPTYECWQVFFSEDTSAIGGSDTVNTSGTAVSIAVPNDWGDDDIGTAFDLRLYQYDFGGAVDTGDWRTPTQLAAMTLRAHLNTSGITPLDTYHALTNDALPAAINKGGQTRFVLVASRLVTATAPTGPEYAYLYVQDATFGIQLDVNYTAASSPTITISPLPVDVFTQSPEFSVERAITPSPVDLALSLPSPVLTTPAGGGSGGGPAPFDHFRVYWQDQHGDFIRIDGGPAALDDGLVPLLDPGGTWHGGRLGTNVFHITQHSGALESPPAEVIVVLDLPTAGLGNWMVVTDDQARYTFKLGVRSSPRTDLGGPETLRPPGRPLPYDIDWGSSGREVTLTFRFRAAVEGDLLTPLAELKRDGKAFWVKAPPGFSWDVMRARISALGDSAEDYGWTTVNVTVYEVDPAAEQLFLA